MTGEWPFRNAVPFAAVVAKVMEHYSELPMRSIGDARTATPTVCVCGVKS